MEKAEISAEVHFAQKLASNEKKIRDRAIKRLKKYLLARSSHGGLSEADMVKIWKGLHFCMWMQDKPLLQEELCGRITSLLRSFPSAEGALQFMQVFLETEAREWHGIDVFRLDKFMMMVRDMLRETFTILSEAGWPVDRCRQFAQGVSKKALDPGEPRLPDGLKLHLADIYVDEMGKVELDQMRSRKMVLLLRPFIDFIIRTPKTELAKRILSNVVKKVLDTMSTMSHLTKSEEAENKEILAMADEKRAKKRRSRQQRRPYHRGNNKVDYGDEEEEAEEMEEEGEDNSGDEEDEGEDGTEGVDSGLKDDDEMMQEVDDVDEDNGSDNEEDMEACAPTFQLDAEFMLIVLLQLAKGSEVKSANRSLVYSLVKKHPEVYQNVIDTLNSCTDGKFQAKDDSDTEGVCLEDLALFHGDGAGKDQQNIKRKRNKKNKQNRQQEHQNDENKSQHETSQASANEAALSQPKVGSKNMKIKTTVEEMGSGDATTSKKKSAAKRKRSVDEIDSPSVPKAKKLLPSAVGDDDIESNSTLNETQSSPQPSDGERKKNKKKKKKSELTGDSNTETVVGVDRNSNARENSVDSSTRKPNNSSAATDKLMTPVEMIVYPQKKSPSSSLSPAKGGDNKAKKSKKSSKGEKSDDDEGQQQSGWDCGGDEPRRSKSPPKAKKATKHLSPSPKHVRENQSQPAPSTPTSSLSLAASLFTASAERQKHGKKSRKSTNSAETGSSGDAPPDAEGLGCQSEAKDSTPPASSPGVMSSILSSIKERLVDPLLSPTNPTDVRSESSMDWSVASKSEHSMASQAAQDEDKSRTDPGPDRKKAKGQSKSADTSMTPCGKKKVVFDLRKNRANKFTDYIKSLQRQPESPHLPGRSPSNSILKPQSPSPSVVSVTGGSSGSGGKKKFRKSPNKGKQGGSTTPSSRVKAVRSRSNTRQSS